LDCGFSTEKTNPANEADPADVVTLTSPLAPAPTTAVMVVELTTENEVAAVPPKLTAVAPVKSVPVIVTVAPVAAEVGAKAVIVGAGVGVGAGSLFLHDQKQINSKKQSNIFFIENRFCNYLNR
jgi:hypothetical protein